MARARPKKAARTSGKKAARPGGPRRRRVIFTLNRSEAREVALVGDFNRWDPQAHPMRRDEAGVWRKAVLLFPGRYEYRFLVDGQWCNDPVNAVRCANCFGTENDVLVVAG